MTAAPKIELLPCLFCGKPMDWLEGCDEDESGRDVDAFLPICGTAADPGCGYIGATRRTKAEAAHAHNQVALAVRLFPRACELLRGLRFARGYDPELDDRIYVASGLDREWDAKRRALLTEAQGGAS